MFDGSIGANTIYNSHFKEFAGGITELWDDSADEVAAATFLNRVKGQPLQAAWTQALADSGHSKQERHAPYEGGPMGQWGVVSAAPDTDFGVAPAPDKIVWPFNSASQIQLTDSTIQPGRWNKKRIEGTLTIQNLGPEKAKVQWMGLQAPWIPSVNNFAQPGGGGEMGNYGPQGTFVNADISLPANGSTNVTLEGTVPWNKPAPKPPLTTPSGFLPLIELIHQNNPMD